MKNLLIILFVGVVAFGCGDPTTAKSGKVEVVNHLGEYKRTLNYINKVENEMVYWVYLDSTSTDTLIEFSYKDSDIPKELCYNNRCDGLVESIKLEDYTILKFYGYDENVQDSEGSWFLSTRFGIVGSFGHRPPEYFYTDINSDFVRELKEQGLPFK